MSKRASAVQQRVHLDMILKVEQNFQDYVGECSNLHITASMVSYCKPSVGPFCVGYVYNDRNSRFEDGQEIMTGEVISVTEINSTMYLVYTKHSLYMVLVEGVYPSFVDVEVKKQEKVTIPNYFVETLVELAFEEKLFEPVGIVTTMYIERRIKEFMDLYTRDNSTCVNMTVRQPHEYSIVITGPSFYDIKIEC